MKNKLPNTTKRSGRVGRGGEGGESGDPDSSCSGTQPAPSDLHSTIATVHERWVPPEDEHARPAGRGEEGRHRRKGAVTRGRRVTRAVIALGGRGCGRAGEPAITAHSDSIRQPTEPPMILRSLGIPELQPAPKKVRRSSIRTPRLLSPPSPCSLARSASQLVGFYVNPFSIIVLLFFTARLVSGIRPLQRSTAITSCRILVRTNLYCGRT